MDPVVGSDSTVPYSDVELCFDADVRHLPLARSVAAAIAVQISEEPDYVDAVRLATNEVVGTLMLAALSDSMVSCLFRVLDSELRLSVAVESRLDHPPQPTPSQVLVLDQLVENASSIAIPSDGGYQIRSDIVIFSDHDLPTFRSPEPR